MSKPKESGGGSLFKDVNNLRHDEENQDAEDLKAKEKFNEFTFFGKIARNQIFEYLTLAVITLNALYLGYDCDYNARWGKPEDLYAEGNLIGFIVMDHFFCLFFTVELLIRFFAYKSKLRGPCCDKAFLFDLVLVTFMVAETWVLAFVGQIDFLKQLSILRLLRLARLLRMGKIMRYFPELQLIVRGMLAAVRSVGCATILLLLVLYVFAIILTSTYHQGLKADDDEDIHDSEVLFGSLGKSMRHLLIMGTILDDITACTNTIRSTENIWMLMAFIVCVLISSFTLFNMLLGILCEVVDATQTNEQTKRDTKLLHDSFYKFFRKMDEDKSGMISKAEFVKMATKPDIQSRLLELHIKQPEFEKYVELLYVPRRMGEPPPSLGHDEAVATIMKLRPGQPVNCCDFNYFKYKLKKNYKGINTFIKQIDAILKEAADCAEEHDNAPTQGQLMSELHEGLEAEKEAAAALKNPNKKSTKKKPVQTMKTLARGPATVVSIPPPVPNRWSDSPGYESPPRPTSPGSPIALLGRSSPRTLPIDNDVVMDRLHVLSEKRRLLCEQVRFKQMSNSGQAFYNGPQPPLPIMGATTQRFNNNGNNGNNVTVAPRGDKPVAQVRSVGYYEQAIEALNVPDDKTS